MSQLITSIHNQRVKEAAKLREHRARQKQKRYLIDGAREILRALQADTEVDEAFVCPELCQSEDAQAALGELLVFGDRVHQVTRPVFEKLAFGHRLDGVLAVARTVPRKLERIQLSERPFVVVLERIEKPGNVGAVLRSADGAGATAVIVVDGGTDLYNPNTIRASLGTIFTMPIATASSAECLDWLRQHKVALYAARVDGSVSYTAADFTRPCAIVLGSEAHGLSDLWHAPDIQAVRLPMLGSADSLNISTTAAVLCYEVLRQRQAG